MAAPDTDACIAPELPLFELIATENVEVLADGRIRDGIVLRVGGEIETAVVWSSGLVRRPIDWEGGVADPSEPEPEWG